MRVLIFGNSGSGKSTMAARLARAHQLACLALDDITWSEAQVRRPWDQSRRDLDRFIDAHAHWVIEGCYSSLIEAALPRCTELRFLNPGVDACVANCRARPWEPDKFASKADQDAMLESLIA